MRLFLKELHLVSEELLDHLVVGGSSVSSE